MINHDKKSISLLIVTYNCRTDVVKCLRSINLDLPLLLDVILVDNGSSDGTQNEIKSYFDEVHFTRFKIIENKENNIGLARKIGAENCAGDLIAILDPDCVAPDNWLIDLHNNYLNCEKRFDSILGVSGPNRLPKGNPLFEPSSLALDFVWTHGRSPQAWIPSDFVVTTHLPTTNCLICKKSLSLIGNFSAELPVVGEDLELGCRSRVYGLQCIHGPGPLMQNNSASSLKEWFYRMISFGRVQPAMALYMIKYSRVHWPGLLPILILILILFLSSGFFPLLFIELYCLLILISFLILLGKTASLKIALQSIQFILVSHTGYGIGQILGVWDLFKLKKKGTPN